MGLGDTLGALPPENGGTGRTTSGASWVKGTVMKNGYSLTLTPPSSRPLSDFQWCWLGGDPNDSHYLCPVLLPLHGPGYFNACQFDNSGGAYFFAMAFTASGSSVSIRYSSEDVGFNTSFTTYFL